LTIMEIKFTKSFLGKLEDLMAASGYILRYEKGNFKSGYCVLKEMKVAVVNKFFPLEGRVNALVDIIKELDIDEEQLEANELKLYQALKTHHSQPSKQTS